MNEGEIIFCHNYGLYCDECIQNKNLNLSVPFKAGDIVEVENKRKQLFEIFNYISEKKVHSSDITEELLDTIYGEVLANED